MRRGGSRRISPSSKKDKTARAGCCATLANNVSVISTNVVDLRRNRRYRIGLALACGSVHEKIQRWRILSRYGTLSPTIVLTSAHCTAQAEPEDIKVLIQRARSVSVARIIVHPGFSMETIQNDIAILVLDGQLSPPFVTISSQRSTDSPPGTLALVAAFDLFVHGQDKPLLQAAVPIVESGRCLLQYNERYFADTEICASEIKVLPVKEQGVDH